MVVVPLGRREDVDVGVAVHVRGDDGHVAGGRRGDRSCRKRLRPVVLQPHDGVLGAARREHVHVLVRIDVDGVPATDASFARRPVAAASLAARSARRRGVARDALGPSPRRRDGDRLGRSSRRRTADRRAKIAARASYTSLAVVNPPSKSDSMSCTVKDCASFSYQATCSWFHVATTRSTSASPSISAPATASA